MLTENEKKSANYARIVYVLQSMKEDGLISAEEYKRAKKYYQSLTGSDLVLLD